VSDEFLLNLAAISATLLGLLVVGVIFYVETGLRRLERNADAVASYIRSAAKLTMALYAATLAVTLSLVAFVLVRSRVVFAVASLAIVLSLTSYSRYAATMARVIGPRAWSLPYAVVLWTSAAVVIAAPWLLGGLRPRREDLTVGVLLILLSGLVSTFSILLSVFDIASFEGRPRTTGQTRSNVRESDP